MTAAQVPDPLPPWLTPLAAAARTVRPEDLSRFLPPDDGSGRASAVLMALAETAAGPSIVMIERAADMRAHPGQVAFPGGAADPSDPDRVGTALREAEEEVGLNPDSVQIVAELPVIFLPPSRFLVTPVLAWWRTPQPLTPGDPAEVARVALVPLAALSDPANRFTVRHPSGWLGPGFEVDGLFTWGFTAGLLDRVLTLGGWAGPWDESVQRPLPPGVLGRQPPLPS